MLHDSAHSHIATAMQDLIMTFGWEQFDHLPYSPDFMPSDFHVFLHLTTFLGGWRFQDDNEVKEAVNMWFVSQAASFYDSRIQKNWFPGTTSASTMVETMSKCSVWYVYQMAI
jgi:histone-lysine N-methyltransferase SETMAR